MTINEIAISITEGRTIRDLFYNGLLNQLHKEGFNKITIFTEAIHVNDFVSEFQSESVEFRELHGVKNSRSRSRAYLIRRKLTRYPLLQRFWHKVERRLLYSNNEVYLNYFRNANPRLLLTTHNHLRAEFELICAAELCNVATIGIVRSWDNVHKGIWSKSQKMLVWNEINKEELIKYEGYREDEVVITGAPQFDTYFEEDSIIGKNEFMASKEFDPSKPYILFASLGYFFPGNDETEWVRTLLEIREKGLIPHETQIICRLHPWSRYEHFKKFEDHNNFIISYCDKYWPALTWYMSKDDMRDMANMIKHADIVITPGSTVTLEAAIFDRPTIVPIFHSTQKERMKNYFDTWVFGKHFARIRQNGLVPIAEDKDSFVEMINHCLSTPEWYREQRAKLVEEYVHFTDGKAVERIAQEAGQWINR